ncbi:MAG TPA: chemotaxis protein CheB [Burkholderiaceae bacterium]|nr:chemotaxis protein CheB [Burkholderiaceae bacterium]
MRPEQRLIVIGASAGGVPALMRLVSELPFEFAAPLLIVQHIGTHQSVLPQLLAARSRRDAAHAIDGERLKPGTIRVAPPDHHMLVADGAIVLNRGPRENLARPAIDPLFRSAALAHGPGVIGVVLTGRLDDGTVGLQEIKRRGGITVVQDPEDADEPSMPRSAIRHVEVDHVVPLALMPMLLISLAARDVAPAPAPPVAGPALAETKLAMHRGNPMAVLNEIARPSTYVCPECQGALWQILDSRPTRFRCHTGHAFTARTLQSAMTESSDQAGWSALRAMQERTLLLHQLADLERGAGHDDEAKRLEASAAHIERQVGVLHQILEDGPEPIE